MMKNEFNINKKQDAFRHKPSGIMIDFRFFQRVKQLEEFRKFCLLLENYSDCDRKHLQAGDLFNGGLI